MVSILAKRFPAVALAAAILAATPLLGDEAAQRDKSLISWAGHGNAEKVAELLDQGADSNAADKYGRTALHRASGDGHIEVMELLIEAGADVNAKDHDGATPLSKSTSRLASLDAMKLLLNAGAKADDESLESACRSGELEKVKLVLAAGAKPDSGVATSAQSGNLEILRLLIDKGAPVNQVLKGGYTPLHVAALQGGPEVVELLLKHRAELNVQDEQGETPLHNAVAGNVDLRVVKLLVDAGAKLDVPDNEGQTPVRLAGVRGVKPVYDYLLKASGGKEPAPARLQQPAAKDAKSVAELASDLGSLDHKVRQAASRELALRGEQVVPEIIGLIESGTPIERFYETFAVIGPAAAPAIPLMEKQIAKKEHVMGVLMTISRIKPGAFEALSDESKEKAAGALYEIVVDPKADVTGGFAARMLVGLGEPAVPTLIRLLEHETPGFRAGAARYLEMARFNNEQTTAALKKLTESDPIPLVRTAAAKALAASGNADEKSRAALVAIIKRPPPHDYRNQDEVKQREIHQWRDEIDDAGRALGQFGPDVIDDLLPLLTPMDHPNRKAAVTALKDMGPPAVPRLMELLASNDNAIAVAASIALGDIGKPAIEPLLQLLKGDDANLVRRAARALSSMHGAARPALPSLLTLAASKEQARDIRVFAAFAALKISGGDVRNSPEILSTIPILIEVLEQGTFKQQVYAADTLKIVGPAAREALPMLRKRLEPPEKEVDTEGFAPYAVKMVAQDAIDAIEKPKR